MSILHDVEWAVGIVLKECYSQTVYDLWFKDLRLEVLTDNHAVFSINSSFKKNILQNRHADALAKALEEVNGFSVTVEIVVREDMPPPDLTPDPKEDSVVTDEIVSRADAEVAAAELEEVTDPDELGRAIESRSIVSEYTFENFIVGASNKFAHAACLAVAQSPTTYNPLFIHGPSGLGKTHLLYAVTNELKKNNPNLRLIYKKGEEFTNELIESLQKGAMGRASH